ncbi:MAG: hypothetical protein AAFV53_21470 [Myxococcota bacterium]
MQSIFLGLLATAGVAHAGGFEAKTMRDPLSAREVERGLVLGKGWLNFTLATDIKSATGFWGPDGEAEDFEDATWLYTTQSFDFRYGISRRTELFWTFKTHYVNLQNDTLGTDITQFGLGDPVFGIRYELFRSIAPLTSAIAYFKYKAPLANETPGNFVGGPNTFSRVVLTTGTPDLHFGGAIKRQFSFLAIDADASYIFRTSGVPLYAIETQNNQFNARIKPGDVVRLQARLTAQVSLFALQGGAVFESRQPTRVGNTSSGLLPSSNLNDIEGSEGTALDATAGVVANLTRGIDLEFQARFPITGEDLLFFPIEDIHPTRGITYTGAFEFRY